VPGRTLTVERYEYDKENSPKTNTPCKTLTGADDLDLAILLDVKYKSYDGVLERSKILHSICAMEVSHLMGEKIRIWRFWF
jgi:hypothetical protein